MKLYSYFRSSSSYRVRVALNLKSIEYDYVPVHLLNNGGEQFLEEYLKKNPSKEVPCLEHNGAFISQSLAIITYLEDLNPSPSLIPQDPQLKAKALQICEIINSGIQPIQNLNVVKTLISKFNLPADRKVEWMAHWIENGFKPLEENLKNCAGKYSMGDELTIADLFLVPQVYNAERFEVDMKQFPLIKSINENCLQLEAFQKAHPDKQPDTPKA